jgi:tRNA G18 (ribose-2'-O)-methylase SpoU
LTLTADAVDLERVSAELGSAERLAILFGAEGGGLSAGWTRGAELRAKIPMSAGIDSLNVAAASAIACYVLGPRSAGTRGVTGQSPG